MLPLDSMICPTENKISNVYKILTTVLRNQSRLGYTNAIIMYDDPIYTCDFSVKIFGIGTLYF